MVIHKIPTVVFLFIATEECIEHDSWVVTVRIAMDNGIFTPTTTRIEYLDFGQNIKKGFIVREQNSTLIHYRIDSDYDNQFISCILGIHNNYIQS